MMFYSFFHAGPRPTSRLPLYRKQCSCDVHDDAECTSINDPDLSFSEIGDSRSISTTRLSSLLFPSSMLPFYLVAQRLFPTQTMNHHTGPALDARLSTTLTSLSANSASHGPPPRPDSLPFRFQHLTCFLLSQSSACFRRKR